MPRGRQPAPDEERIRQAREAGLELRGPVRGVRLAFRCLAAGHPHRMTWPAFRQRRSSANATGIPVCPSCVRDRKGERYLEGLRRDAMRYGHALLSTRYENNVSPLTFRCQVGHEWATTANQFREEEKTGVILCRLCSGSGGERVVRAILEAFFPGHRFPSRREKWLRNPRTQMPLQLDCYCKELSLAVEHQGEQHVRPVAQLHVDEARLADIRFRDAVKRELCHQHGVTLVEFHERDSRGGLEDVRARLAKALQGAGVVLPVGWETRTPDPRRLATPPALERHHRIDAYVESRGGRLLSAPGQDPVVDCGRGHPLWRPNVFDLLKERHWCPACAGHSPRSIADVRAFLADRRPGWTVISTSMRSIHEVLELRCEHGHPVRRSFKKLRAAARPTCSLCPKAATRGSSLAKHRESLAGRALECISTQWLGSAAKHDYRCLACGHRWSATANNVQRPTYRCPACARATGSARRRADEAAAASALSGVGLRLVGAYEGRHRGVAVECVECGTRRIANFGNLVRGASRCPCRRRAA